MSTFVFAPHSQGTAQSWQSLARFRALQLDAEGAIADAATQEEVLDLYTFFELLLGVSKLP